MLTFEVDDSEFRSLVAETLETLEKGVDYAVEASAVEGAEAAKRAGRFQDRTGRLRSGIVAYFISRNGRSVTWEILSPARYSVFVENPTKPHKIRARNGGFLAFKGSSGETVFRREVQHPGTPGFPFMGPGFLQAERTLEREVNLVVRRVERIW